MIIVRTDPVTGAINRVDLDITEEQLKDWHSGTVVQKAFPRLNADEREYILTGILPGEFKCYVGEEENDNSYEDGSAF